MVAILYENVDIGFMSHHKDKKCQQLVVTKEHCHENNLWEMVYYVNYDGTFVFNNEKTPYRKNTVILIPPNAMHYEFSESAVELYFCMFYPMFSHKQDVFVFQDYSNHFFETMFAQCFYLKNSGASNWENHLSMVLGCVEQYIASLELQEDTDLPSLLEQRIAERFMDPAFQVSNLLKEMPFSPWYQRKLFKEATGITPTQYLNKLRINYACTLLASSAMPIKVIALSCGFEDPYYFSRLFKSIMKMSPAQWRAEHVLYTLSQSETKVFLDDI